MSHSASATQSQFSTQKALPLCVYCGKAMRMFLVDHTQEPEPMALFRCNSCGWEAMVPMEAGT